MLNELRSCHNNLHKQKIAKQIDQREEMQIIQLENICISIQKHINREKSKR